MRSAVMASCRSARARATNDRCEQFTRQLGVALLRRYLHGERHQQQAPAHGHSRNELLLGLMDAVRQYHAALHWLRRWFAAAQHIMAMHQRHKRWILRLASVTHRVTRVGVLAWNTSSPMSKSWFMSPSKNRGALSAPIPCLLTETWKYLRARLSHRLSRLAEKGERDVWRLANGAIFELRRELVAA